MYKDFFIVCSFTVEGKPEIQAEKNRNWWRPVLFHRIIEHDGVVPGDAMLAEPLLGTDDAHEHLAHVADAFVVPKLRPGHADSAGDQFAIKAFVRLDIGDHKGRVPIEQTGTDRNLRPVTDGGYRFVACEKASSSGHDWDPNR